MSDLTPDVQAALDNLRTVNWDHLGAGELADAEQLVVERIQSAYRSALAGETDVMEEAAAKAVMAEMGPFENADEKLLWLGRVTHVLKVAAPILRAPLRVQLQDKEAEIAKCLELVMCQFTGYDLEREQAKPRKLFDYIVSLIISRDGNREWLDAANSRLQDKEERIETLEQERDVFRHTLNALHGAITNGVFLAATGEDAPLAQREFDNLCVVLGYRRNP